MMAIHHTLQLLTIPYHDEPTHIIDYLSVLYLLNTQIKHPTIHKNHPNKIILESPHTNHHTPQVRTHANIDGNEHTDTQAKWGHTLDHRNAIETCPPYTILPPRRLVALLARDTRQRPHQTP